MELFRNHWSRLIHKIRCLFKCFPCFGHDQKITAFFLPKFHFFWRLCSKLALSTLNHIRNYRSIFSNSFVLLFSLEFVEKMQFVSISGIEYPRARQRPEVNFCLQPAGGWVQRYPNWKALKTVTQWHVRLHFAFYYFASPPLLLSFSWRWAQLSLGGSSEFLKVDFDCVLKKLEAKNVR